MRTRTVSYVVPAIGGPDFPRKRESMLSRPYWLNMGSRFRGNDVVGRLGSPYL